MATGGPGWLTARPVAHRGLHDAARGIIENAPAAFDAAITGDYGIELDLQPSADGEAMVFHDATLDRLTDARGPISARTAAELGAIGYRGTTDRIATLPQVMAQAAGRVPLVIEIKSEFSGDLRLARRAAELVTAYDGPAALMSFDPAVLVEVAVHAPDAPLGIIAEANYSAAHWPPSVVAQGEMLADMLHWQRTRFTFINYRVADLARPAVKMFRGAGVPVLTWTVRTPADRARAAEGADQIVFEGFRP